ncbi:MAG TPA: YggS family pyridoxal phosphate-dependent enzyme [Chloroflexia bacterium]|nr:YggS family pyridoxal phosphate-dependent enzyme [Chloroflexia bacterium]
MTYDLRLDEIRERIAMAAGRSGRTSDAVTLVVVTKTIPVDRIEAVIEAGAVNLGENRVQEAEAKFEESNAQGTNIDTDKISRAGITLHMIGGLQRNKARRAVGLFDWIQSVDRPELLAALESAGAEQEITEPFPVLLEVNMTGEAAKSGITPAELPGLADALATCPHLRGMGLMTVARLGADEKELRSTFAGLRHLLDMLKTEHPHAGDWKHLSMGMSDDYEYAIEEGATIVRLGRAIFGPRI